MRRPKLLICEETAVILFCIVLLAFSYGPLAFQYLNPPSGKVFLGSFGFPEDFFGNLITFKNGQLGHWRHIPKITSTIAPATSRLMKIDYIFLGQISRLFPLESTVFFNLTRLFLSGIFLILSYRLITLVFKEKNLRLAAFLLTLFSTAIGSKNLLLALWSPLTAFQRAAYYPHYLIGFCLLLLIIPLIANLMEKNHWQKLATASLLGIAIALIHSPAIICLYLSFPFYLISRFLQKDRWSEILRKTIILGLFAVISCLPLLYFKQVSQSYPWNLIPKLDLFYSLNKNISLFPLLFGIGPTAFLAIIGSYHAAKSKNQILTLLFPWSFTYLIGFFWFYQFISTNSIRFLQTPYFLFLSILSVTPLQTLAKKTRIDILVLAALFLVPSIGGLKTALETNRINFAPSFWYINSPIEIKAAYDWLAKNTKEQDTVLSAKDNGMLIAALAGNTPYITHLVESLDEFPVLENNTAGFYCHQWNEREAKKFLQEEHISFVFYSDEEKYFCGRDTLNYPFLIPIFTNARVVIYKVDFSK